MMKDDEDDEETNYVSIILLLLNFWSAVGMANVFLNTNQNYSDSRQNQFLIRCQNKLPTRNQVLGISAN